jgi:hypothetical protein
VLVPRRAALVAVLLVAFSGASAEAQTTGQLWGNLTLNWVKSQQITYELDLEPKLLVYAPEGESGWANLDLTPNVEYSAKRWLDLSAEATTGYTKQTDDVNTIELSPRVGARFHLFSRGLPTYGPRVRELQPGRRLTIRDLVRFESRNLFYRGSGSGSSFTVRFRNRLDPGGPEQGKDH